MPDTEISRLEELPSGLVEARDVLAIVDTSASETKKVSSVDLVQRGVELLPDGSIDPDHIDWTGVDPGAINGSAITDRTIGAVKLVANSLTAAEIAPNAIGSTELADSSVDTAALQDLSVTGGKISNSALVARHYSAGSVGSDALAENSVGSSELANGACDTAAIQDDAVTEGKLAPNLNGDNILAAGSINAALAANSVGSSELADLSVDTTAIQDSAVTNVKLATGIDGAKITDNTIANSKLSTGIDGNKITAGTITDAKLASGINGAKITNNTISNNKLSTGIDGSKITAGTVADAQLAGGINGTKITDNTISNDKLSSGIDGAKIVDSTISNSKLSSGIDGNKLIDASVGNDKIGEGINGNKLSNGSVGDTQLASGIDGAKLTDGSLSVTALNPTGFGGGIELGENGLIQHTNSITAGNRNGITFDAQGHITSTAALIPSDLPVATDSAVGGVFIPPESGLSVSASGGISQQNSITAGTTSGITFNTHGFITATTPLTGSDLPAATTTTLGGVVVPTANNNPLTVDGAGNITHAPSGIVAGTYASTTVDIYGHVVSGDITLSVNQVPDLPASKITTGQFGTVRIEDHSVTGQKIADYATCYMQEDTPGSSGEFLGQLWYQPSTAQLRVYARGSAGNQWLPVGFGALQQQNLRVGFTFDASTSTIVSITQYGASAGLVAGDPIPAATDQNSGIYGVCVVAGNNITLPDVNGQSFTAGDWILDISETAGWIFVDVTSGGGGGGGAQVLNDLLDVEIAGEGLPPLQNGQILQYHADIGQWVNTDFSTGVLISDTAPTLTEGLLWWSSADASGSGGGRLYVCYDDGDSMQWVPATPDAYGTGIGGGGGGGGAEFLNDLKDVNAPNPTANAFLSWDDSSNRWVPATTIDCGTF